MSRRNPASSHAVAPSRVMLLGERRRGRGTSSIDCSISLTNAVPRSKLSVTIATRQPSFSAPTRLATGMRTSSRNTSQNSVLPSIVRSGRTSMPGEVHRHDQPRDARCLGTSGSVRTSSSQ